MYNLFLYTLLSIHFNIATYLCNLVIYTFVLKNITFNQHLEYVFFSYYIFFKLYTDTLIYIIPDMHKTDFIDVELCHNSFTLPCECIIVNIKDCIIKDEH